jgi:hypothetical protein
MTTRTLTDTATITQDVATAGQLKLNVPASVTLTTPNIGVATATSVNKVAITAPATSATLTVANGKTFTASNSVTISGSDGSSLNVGYNSDATLATTLGNASASGAYSIVIGNNAQSSVDGQMGLAIGRDTSITKYYSIALGYKAKDNSAQRIVFAQGDVKVQRYTSILSKQTSDATPAILSVGGSTPSASNQVLIGDNSCQSFRGRVIGFTSDSTAACGFEFSGLIRRTANAASTALVSAVTPVAIGTPDAALSTASVAVTADTPNGALAFTVTGVAATTINWTCVVDSELRAT